MKDESGVDNKILAVPVEKICRQYGKVNSKNDLDEIVLAQIEHFFEHYKKLEPGKWVEIDSWCDAAAAKQEILNCIKRYEGVE
jgi:inorganic pyrophosphatase